MGKRKLKLNIEKCPDEVRKRETKIGIDYYIAKLANRRDKTILEVKHLGQDRRKYWKWLKNPASNQDGTVKEEVEKSDTRRNMCFLACIKHFFPPLERNMYVCIFISVLREVQRDLKLI